MKSAKKRDPQDYFEHLKKLLTLEEQEEAARFQEEFLKLTTEKIENYLRDNNFPEKYTAENVIESIKSDKIKPIALVEYLEDSNTLLFATHVTGAEIYRSDDGGATWRKTHTNLLENMVFTYGYYFGQIRVHPKNHDKI